MVALSQLSRPDRDAKTKKIRPPVLSDLRSSGQIEQDADVVDLYKRQSCDRADTLLRTREAAGFNRSAVWQTGSGTAYPLAL